MWNGGTPSSPHGQGNEAKPFSDSLNNYVGYDRRARPHPSASANPHQSYCIRLQQAIAGQQIGNSDRLLREAWGWGCERAAEQEEACKYRAGMDI